MSFWLPRIAFASLWNRRLSAFLTILSIIVAVMLFTGINKLREGAKHGFSNALVGTHLIVGARTADINLLLYTVFRMGEPTAEIRWQTYEMLKNRPDVDWTIPISLGDSYRGYRVIGTNENYFTYYQYGNRQNLRFKRGQIFDPIFGAVIGAKVAAELNLQIGNEIGLAHGLRRLPGAADHSDRPFKISGILEATGTPVDNTIHVPLEGITAIHVGWETGTRNPYAGAISVEQIKSFNLTPKTITASLVGLKNDARSILRTQRALNTYSGEPLSAVIPSAALASLWALTGAAEGALLAIAFCVVFASLISIGVSILASLSQRRREIAVLRAIGTRPRHILGLLVFEAGFIGLIGALAGIGLTLITSLAVAPIVQAQYGLTLTQTGLNITDVQTIIGVMVGAIIVSLIPALMAYNYAVNDGLSQV